MSVFVASLLGTDVISIAFQPYWLLIVVFLFLKTLRLHVTQNPTRTWIAAFAPWKAHGTVGLITVDSLSLTEWASLSTMARIPITTRCLPDASAERNASISMSLPPHLPDGSGGANVLSTNCQ